MPVRLDYKQAKELEKKNLSQFRGLTSGGGSGIMNMRNDASSESIEWVPKKERISPERFKILRDYAKSKGILLHGFKTSDVDVNAVMKSVDSIAKVTEHFPELSGTPKKPLTLMLSDTMRPNDFASTDKGVSHIIKLNGDAFRDEQKLQAEYQKLTADNWFVRGTDYTDIVKHELGHLYQTFHKISDEEIIEMALRSSGETDKKLLFRFLEKSLSKYSGSYKDGSEIISEVFADYFGSEQPTVFSKKFMSELIKMR